MFTCQYLSSLSFLKPAKNISQDDAERREEEEEDEEENHAIT